MAVVKNLMIRAGADFSSMRKEMSKANKNLSDFKRNVTRTMTGIGIALSSLGIGRAINEAAKDAMNVEASLMLIERQMGSSAKAFEDWAKTQAGAFNLAQSDALKYGAVFSNLTTTFAKDTAQAAEFTTNLLKASAITASVTGRTMQDVMERIRSGLLGNTEAIEDLGISIYVNMIESTKAFKRFAGDKSWNQLDFQTQQTIRYFAIMEQVATKFGDEIYNNTNSRVQQLTASLKDAKLALGQAVLPIYNLVLPGLTALTRSLANALQYVVAFSQALFGSKQKQQTKATEAQSSAVTDLGDAYETAGKQAKGSVAGFDQVNLLGFGSVGGVIGNPTKALADMTNPLGDSGVSEKIDETSDKMKKLADQIRNLISDQDRKRVTDAIDELGDSFDRLKESISGFMHNESVIKVAGFIKEMSVGRLTGTILTLSGAFDGLSGTLKGIDGILSGDFGKAFSGAEDIVSGLYDSVNGFAYLISPQLGDKMAQFKKDFAEKWKGLRDDIKKYGDPAKLEALDFIDYIKDYISQRWTDLRQDSRDKWADIRNAISEKYQDIRAIRWSDVTGAIRQEWKEIRSDTLDEFNRLKGIISNKWQEITDIDFDGVKIKVLDIWGDLKKETRSIFDDIETTIKNALNRVINLANRVIGNLNTLNVDVPDWVPFAGGKSFGINIKPFPKLARGGLAFGPTLAQVGDNRNASMDPEVIAPLSKLQGMLEGNDNREVVAVLKAILSAIRQSGNSDTLTMSKTALGRVAAAGLDDLTRRTGKMPITI